MQVAAEISLIPIGTSVSLSPYIARVQEVLEGAGLDPEMHANGTNVEGDWDRVMGAVRECHEAIHAMGVVRINTSLKISTRTDRDQTLSETVMRARDRLT
jgi:uncharacterized protein (TIGR00106 family)